MSEKNCNKCKELKPLSEFSKNNNSKDGLAYKCRLCARLYDLEYNHSEAGHLNQMYRDMHSSSKYRGHQPPKFTKVQFISFCYKEGYKALHQQWILYDYDISYAPSADRTDDYQGYCLSRLALGTWKQNRDNAYADRRNGVNNKHSKAVVQMTLSGEFVAEYYSLRQSERITGINQSNISACYRGNQKTSGGYRWMLSLGIPIANNSKGVNHG